MPVECDYNCKRPACPNVDKHNGRYLCSRCKCTCDGKTVEEKVNRKRGKRKRKSVGKNVNVRTAAKKAGILLAGQRKDDTKLEELVKVNTIQSLRELAEAFNFSDSTLKNFPSKKDRAENADIAERDKGAYSTMLQALLKVLNKVADIVYPAASMQILEDAASRILPKTSNKEKIGNTFMNIISALEHELPKASVERRVVRALLTKCLTNEAMKELRQKGRLKMGGAAKTQAYNDYKLLAQGEKLEKTLIRRQFFDEDVIEAMVKHILSEENIGTLSWGSKSVSLDDR